MEVADDDTADHHMRMSTLKKTWKKAEEGHPVTGASRLQELTGEDQLVSYLYMLLVNSAEMQKLDEFMGRFAKIVNTSDIVQMDIAGLKDVQWMMTVGDFRHTYNNQRIQFGDGKLIPLPQLMLSSPQAIEVHGLGFNPEQGELYYRGNGPHQFRMVNTWRGCDIPPAESVTGDEVKVFTDYVKDVMASGDEATYEWVMAWLADLFQHPASKSGTALVLVGKTGAGKSVLGDRFIRRIIGTNHSMQVNNVESLTGKFNADTSGSLFIQCDEAMNSNRRADAQKLKSAITDPTKRLEKKGHDAFQVEDFARYMFTSNELLTAVAIIDGMDDRRYSVIEVNPEYGYSSTIRTQNEKADYWDRVYDWTENNENLAKVHQFLIGYEYDRKLIRRPLETKAKTNMAHQSQQGVDDWLMAMASMGHPFEGLRDWGQGQAFVFRDNKWEEDLSSWPELATMATLVEAYNAHRKTKMIRNGAPDYNPQQLKTELVNRNLLETGKGATKTIKVAQTRQIGDETVVKKTSLRCAVMFSREKLMEYLTEKVGMEFSESEEIDLSGGGFNTPDDEEPLY
jgi:ABC-type oligopeptide transport system ATPase subunit